MKARITMGTTYCGCPNETIEIEVYDKEEFDSDEFSTEILNAILNREFAHYYLDCELVDDDGEPIED